MPFSSSYACGGHRFWRIDFLLAKVVNRVELKTAIVIGRLAP
jgi:hypothetical protein